MEFQELSGATLYSKCIAGALVVIVPAYYKEGLPAQEFALERFKFNENNLDNCYYDNFISFI